MLVQDDEKQMDIRNKRKEYERNGDERNKRKKTTNQ